MAESEDAKPDKKTEKSVPDAAGRKNFVLRIRADLFEKVEAWAQDDFRSTNSQIEYIIHEALRKAGRLKK